MVNSHLKLITPAILKRTVTPKRPPNRDLRTREYLTEAEVERLTTAAKGNRYGHRNATMVLMSYRHGLRASELADLRWDQIDFAMATLHVRRVKQGTPSTHPILGDELRALRRLQREQEPRSSFVFTSERGAPFSTAGFARMRKANDPVSHRVLHVRSVVSLVVKQTINTVLKCGAEWRHARCLHYISLKLRALRCQCRLVPLALSGSFVPVRCTC